MSIFLLAYNMISFEAAILEKSLNPPALNLRTLFLFEILLTWSEKNLTEICESKIVKVFIENTVLNKF